MTDVRLKARPTPWGSVPGPGIVLADGQVVRVRVVLTDESIPLSRAQRESLQSQIVAVVNAAGGLLLVEY